MTQSDFDQLPSDSQIWIYGFKQKLTPGQQQQVEDAVCRFTSAWLSHGQPVRSAFRILKDRFLVLAAHCEAGVSGCSIDSSVQVFKELSRNGLDALDRSIIYYQDDSGEVQAASIADFQAKVESGKVGPDTTVFDTTLTALEEFRNGRWSKPFKSSWHARRFG